MMPSVMIVKVVGLPTSLNDEAFVIPLASKEEVMLVYKLGEFNKSKTTLSKGTHLQQSLSFHLSKEHASCLYCLSQ